MLYLLAAVLTSTSILIAFRLFKKLSVNTLQAIVINYLTATMAGYCQASGAYTFSEIPGKPWFFMALITGITLIAGFNLYAFSAQKAGVTITALAGRISLVIPVSMGFILFDESLNFSKILGIVLALVAFYLSLHKEKKIAPNWKYFLLPISLFLVSGANDSFLKTAQYFYIQDDFVLFLATSFLLCFLLGIIILLLKSRGQQMGLSLTTIGAGIMLGLLNWFSTLFMLKGLSLYDISIFLPVLNVSILSLSAICGFFFFREKFSPINLAGLITAMLAIALLSHA